MHVQDQSISNIKDYVLIRHLNIAIVHNLLYQNTESDDLEINITSSIEQNQDFGSYYLHIFTFV